MITEITSPANELFKQWKTLDQAKGIRKAGSFFLMGEKLIREFLESCDDPMLSRFRVQGEILSEKMQALTPSAKKVSAFKKIPIFQMAPGLFRELDVIGTHFNLLLLELPELPAFETDKAPLGLELICPIGDPGNLGAVVRSALAFGARQLILTQEAAFPFSPKAVKASAGSVLRLPMVRAGALCDLTLEGVYALDMEGSDLSGFRWPRDLRLLVGEEGPGLGSLKGLMKLKINTGPVESLNATVAASIAMYSYQTSL